MTGPSVLLLDRLNIGDVVDFQTLGDGDWFIGLTIQDMDDTCMIVKPVHKRPVHELGAHQFWVPWSALAWLRLGTGSDTFTDPDDDPVDRADGEPEAED